MIVTPIRDAITTAKNDLGYDAWGRNKVVNDYSMWHGLFTYNVADEMWIEEDDGVEVLPKVKATSVNGMLQLTSSGTTTGAYLKSKRHPRYQPNRGWLYSTAMIWDTISSSGKLYAVVRSKVGDTVTDERKEIPIPDGVDLSAGNIFDIQAQWRGVGGIKFFINLKEVYHFNYLGTLTGASVFNPAMPLAFECLESGKMRCGAFTSDAGLFFEYEHPTAATMTMRCGCVDVSSEGGFKENRQFRSITTGDDDSVYSDNNSDLGTVLIAMHIPETISYGGYSTPYTRDVILTKINTACRTDEIITGVYYCRRSMLSSSTAFDSAFSASGSTVASSFVEYILGGTSNLGAPNVAALQTAFESEKANMMLLDVGRAPANEDLLMDNPDPNYSDFYLTAGDYIFLNVIPDAGADVTWGSIKFSEEI